MRGSPVEDGLAFKPEQHVHGCAVDYAGEKALLDITLIEATHG